MTTEISLLGGKVKKRTLPIVRPPSAPDSPTLKRLMLPQGELAQFYDSDDPIRYLAYIELRAGTVRGNHFHKVKEEWIYLIEGHVMLTFEDVNTRERDSVSLETGELVLISTRIAHSLRALEPGFAVEFSKSRFDPADIYRFALSQRVSDH
jgi:hypothetical protein